MTRPWTTVNIDGLTVQGAPLFLLMVIQSFWDLYQGEAILSSRPSRVALRKPDALGAA